MKIDLDRLVADVEYFERLPKQEPNPEVLPDSKWWDQLENLEEIKIKVKDLPVVYACAAIRRQFPGGNLRAIRDFVYFCKS